MQAAPLLLCSQVLVEEPYHHQPEWLGAVVLEADLEAEVLEADLEADLEAEVLEADLAAELGWDPPQRLSVPAHLTQFD